SFLSFHFVTLRQVFCGRQARKRGMIGQLQHTRDAVKILKLGMVLCGILGIVGMAMSGIDRMMEANKLTTITVLVAYALPVVMAGVALVRPPLQPWQAGVSLAGFGLTVVKLRVWDMIRAFGEAPGGFQLMAIGGVVGLILSVIAVMRPEGNV